MLEYEKRILYFYCTFLFCARRVGGMAGERFYSRECDRDDVVVYRFMPEVGQA